MGYACPVCDDPQQDTEHLANHLAFQALTHGDDHEAWLDEHAPGWAEGGPADLAPRLAGLAEEAEYEAVFENTTEESSDGELYDPGGAGAHGHDHGHGHGHTAGDGIDVSNLDPDTREIVDEAQELTREMLDDTDSDDEE